ncbi:nucleolar complex protein 3 homolog [Momordica charantia]|uniref:Nucleolar complex protein 3 homolog n=1 Tax=Momordica charantia TaxID=3673 RepID=A0A6J1D2Q0_MOMCH|nr:nucleolar complex protein 3 homolog [Momordica charantia]
MGKKSANQKQKVILPPELPPEVTEEEIEVSDEDLQFVNKNRDYARFVTGLDTQSITKHVTRVADVEEDALEALYEKRLRKKSLQKPEEENKLQVHRVDALPVKTLDGKLYYRTSKTSDAPENDGKDGVVDEEQVDNSILKLTKAEKRAKLKKIKKVAKKQEELTKAEEVQPTPQAAVLAEVKEDLTAEKAFESKKQKLAELGIELLADPNSNIKSLKEMLQIAKDSDQAIVKLGLLSLLAVFKDIIPGYRIRLPTEKELEMKVSKDVKKMRYYESTLLTVYKGYLQKLISLEKTTSFQHVVIRCICTLLDAVPHFNFRETLLGIVVKNISSPDDVVRKLCCGAIKSLFINEGKHGGEATVEAVRLIANHVKYHDCQLHPDSIEPFGHLTFDEDLGKAEKTDEHSKVKNKKHKKIKNRKESSNLQGNDGRQSMRTKITEEVAADYRAASLAPDVMKQREMQSDTLSAVFETYFRILRHTMHSITAKPEASITASTTSPFGSHPLLAPCLNGLGKFSHLIDLDFMGDLMNYLKRLASGGDNSSEKQSQCLTVPERLQCCIVAFKVMRKNLDALNVDLQDFFVQLYNILLEYRPGRDHGEVLAEALKIMLCDDRQHDMQKAAAFIKRLATFSLCFGSAESLAALVTVKHLLQKNIKCRNLLENDAGGGSVSGSVAKYQPYASDPNLSGALASVLWELDLLWKHYHPTVSTMAASISSMNNAQNQVYVATVSPQQAFKELSLEQESFNPQFNVRKANKRKRGSESSQSSLDTCSAIDENEVKEKLSTRFSLLRDIKENERLRADLGRTTLSLQLYEEYKRQKKRTKKSRNI